VTAREKLERTHAALLDTLDVGITQASDAALCGASAPAVSKWSVKDHLEHLAKANERTVSWVEHVCAGDPGLEHGAGPNLLGRIILFLGVIPRGRGKAPEPTLPEGASAEQLADRLREIRERVGALKHSLAEIQASEATRNHFVFGDLDAGQWLRLSVIHNQHHQKIIRDVLKAGAGP
jgi:hypothetical protein